MFDCVMIINGLTTSREKRLLIIFTSIFLISCKEETKKLNIVLTKNEKTDSTSNRFNSLSLAKSDSLFYKINNITNFKFQDTIVIDNLPIGEYKLEYVDIIGNLITKPINLKNTTEIKIVADSNDIKKFENKTPITNLKKNNYYTIKMKGGCVASFHGYYKINRIENNYYIETFNIKKKIITKSEFNAIKKFESELFTIDGKNICSSTGKMTFEIITDNTKIITDNTCNWNGWSNLYLNLNK